jgi:hypothetical protein
MNSSNHRILYRYQFLAKKKSSSGNKGSSSGSRRSAKTVGVRQVSGQNTWELTHPRCARDRAEDLEEVQAMIEGGESEIAIDELRWLLNGCADFIEAHCLSGTLALSEDSDVPLARGHFGHAYHLGLRALQAAKNPVPVPYQRKANQPFFEAGKGLAWCLNELDKPDLAREVNG